MDCFGIFLQEGTLGKRMFFVSATKQIRYGLFAVVLGFDKRLEIL